MAAPHPSPATSGPTLRPLALLLVALAVLGGVVGCRGLTATAAPPDAAPATVRPVTRAAEETVRIDPPPRAPEEQDATPDEVGDGSDDGALGTSGGRLPDGTTASDERYPGVARLDDDLLRALREASADAAADGVTITLNSGWRSRAYQEHLLDEAVGTYGSRAKAARWVATPDTSPHVSGDAVDVAGPGAASWLTEHGRHYGLCRVYANEPWHVELRPRAVDRGCPGLYADPTHDPRMHR